MKLLNMFSKKETMKNFRGDHGRAWDKFRRRDGYGSCRGTTEVECDVQEYVTIVEILVPVSEEVEFVAMSHLLKDPLDVL